jgi:peptidoglycan/LPS O-acetylase OafA/YrhL
MAVLISHFTVAQWFFSFSENGTGWGQLVSKLNQPYGQFGVRLFFGLSGFLITEILLRCRDVIAAKGLPTLFVARQFFVRRSLRIFPLAYFVVLLCAVWQFGDPGFNNVRAYLGWFLTYTINWRLAYDGQEIGLLQHFWSLAVEEQFYLIWPWFMLLLPRKALLPFILITIVVGPAYRAWATHAGLNDFAIEWATPAALDNLGLGALLAYVWWAKPRWGMWFPWMCLAAAVPVAAMLKLGDGVNYTWRLLAEGLLFTWLVHKAAIGFRGPVGWFLASKPVVYFGRISYGIYVYHGLAPILAWWLLGKFGVEHTQIDIGPATFVVYFIPTLAMAMLSWHLFEKPINDLKRHFKYAGKEGPKVAEKPTPAEAKEEPKPELVAAE